MRDILRILEYLTGMLPGAAAALALFLCLLPWRRRRLRRRGLTSSGVREAGLLLLAMFSGVCWSAGSLLMSPSISMAVKKPVLSMGRPEPPVTAA